MGEKLRNVIEDGMRDMTFFLVIKESHIFTLITKHRLTRNKHESYI